MGTAVNATEDVQSQILQNTLTEVALRQTPAAPTAANTASERREETKCCVICLDTITETCEARPCQHRHFDYICLLSWLEQQAKCPLCKSDVVEVLYGIGSHGDDVGEQGKVYKVPAPRKDTTTQRQTIRSLDTNSPDYVAARIYTGQNANRHRGRQRRDVPPRHERWRVVPEDEALRRRQQVYRDQLYSLHVGANRTSRYRRDLTPQMLNDDPDLVSRARIFLRRELHVFDFLHASSSTASSESMTGNSVENSSNRADDTITRRRANNAEFLLEYIIAIIKTVDMQGSRGQAEDMLADFLGRDNARLLLHELRGFLRSPYSLEAWDRHVQYPDESQSRKRNHQSGETSRDGFRRNRRRSRSPGRDGSQMDESLSSRPLPPGRAGRFSGGDSYRPTYDR